MKEYKRRFVDDNILPRKNAMIEKAKKILMVGFNITNKEDENIINTALNRLLKSYEEKEKELITKFKEDKLKLVAELDKRKLFLDELKKKYLKGE